MRLRTVFDWDEPACVSAAVVLIASATLGMALIYQHVWGYTPCALCLIQRWPYYLGIPLGIALTALVQPRGGGRNHASAGLGILGLVFFISAGMGIYHAGIEWAWWEGPASCSPALSSGSSSVADLFKGNAPRFVACTTASWRFLGLSFAGWNAVLSAALCALAWIGAWRFKKA